MEQPQRSKKTLRAWIDLAILLCTPALLLNFLVALGIILLWTGIVATVLKALFTIILTVVGIVLLIHFTDVASSFFSKARVEPGYRATRAVIGVLIICGLILLVFFIIAGLTRLGSFTGGDSMLMSAEIPIIGILTWTRFQQRQKTVPPTGDKR